MRVLLSLFCILFMSSVFACSQAPAISLRNQEAELITLNHLIKKSKNNIILLSVFQVSCLPCEAEIRYLLDLKNKKSKSNQPSFDLVLIDSKESREETYKFLDKNNFEPDEALSDRYGALDGPYKIKTVPRLFAINKKGMLIRDLGGDELYALRNSDKLAEFIDALIAKPDCQK
jgi:thioredoxin-related protein